MPHMLQIPRELRDKILINVLKSQSGQITLLPHKSTNRFHFRISEIDLIDDSQVEVSSYISLAITQTCKQLHAECDGIFWKHNMLVIWPDDIFTSLKSLRLQQQLQIQRVILKFDLLSVEKYENMALERLEIWASRGSLKTITLSLVEPHTMGLLYRVETCRKALGCHLKAMREAVGPGGSLSKLERKVTLDTRKETGFSSLFVINGFPYPIDVVFEEVHEAFGGELWVDGELKHRKADRKVVGMLVD